MIRFLAEENMLKKWIPAGKFDSGSGNGFYSDSEGKSIFFYRKSGVWDKKLILGAKMAATFRHKKLSILSPVTPPPGRVMFGPGIFGVGNCLICTPPPSCEFRWVGRNSAPERKWIRIIKNLKIHPA